MAHESNAVTMFESQVNIDECLHDGGLAIARADAATQTRRQDAILE